MIKREVVVIQLLESQHLTLAFMDFGQITTMAPIHQFVITQTSMMKQREGLYINVSCTDENQLYIGRKTGHLEIWILTLHMKIYVGADQRPDK